MGLSRWLALIGILVGLGCLQVAQRNAVMLKGYAVGSKMHELHVQETDLAWRHSEIVGLASPARLVQVAQDRRLKLVAWSTLTPPRPRVSGVAEPTGLARQVPGADGRLVSIVSAAARPPSPRNETAD